LHLNNIPSWNSTINAIFVNFPNINSAKVKSLSVNIFKKQVHTALKSLYLYYWNDTRQENLNLELRTYTSLNSVFKERNICQSLKTMIAETASAGSKFHVIN
jgi:hypothetical protein